MDTTAKEKESNVNTLVVDLDGTLLKTDTIFELFLKYLKQDFILAPINCIYWYLHGKARLKNELAAKAAQLDISRLPYRQDVLDFIAQNRKEGKKIVLATGTNVVLARKIAAHLGIFDEALGTHDKINLTGKNKAITLTNKYGEKNFEYIGNSRADLPVWSKAAKAHLVTNDAKLIKKARSIAEIGRVWSGWQMKSNNILRALRPHQWVKNILVFIPMLADHQLNLLVISKTALAFISFSLIASSVYVINDLFDLESDRRHPTKKNRPFAAGQLPIWVGFILIPVLLLISLFLGFNLNYAFLFVLVFYFILNLLYSISIKQIVLLDVIVLASLYTLRVLAGGQAVNITISSWLMALILFLSLSGALMKRYVELVRHSSYKPAGNLKGRGYHTADIPLVGQFGVINGYLSVLVLALYVNSQPVNSLYSTPELWWLVTLLLLYAVSRTWLQAYRDNVDDDPILYLLKDPVNYIIFILTGTFIFLAV